MRDHRSVAGRIVLVCLLGPFLGRGQSTVDAKAWEATVRAVRGGGNAVLPAEDAAGAVDGVTGGGFAFHTGQDDGPWWQVDLGSSQSLDRVVVHAAHCPERLNGFEVLLSDEGEAWRSAYRHREKTDGVGTFRVPLHGQDGRYVRLRVPQRIWMHLAEVEVFPAAARDTNVALKRPALQSSVSQWSTRSIRLEAGSGDWRTDTAAGLAAVRSLVAGSGPGAAEFLAEAGRLAEAGTALTDRAWVELHRRCASAAATWLDVRTQWPLVDPAALRRALDFLSSTFPEAYPKADGLRGRVESLAATQESITRGMASGSAESWQQAAAAIALQEEILLSNPVLDFDRLLLLRRRAANLGLPANWQSNCVLPRTGYGNDLAVLELRDRGRGPRTVYRPADDTFVGDVDLHFDGDRVLFSKSDPKGPWQVHEAELDPATGDLTAEPRQVTPDKGSDINNYDPCYLPDGDILYGSTAPMVAVPCVNGSTHVSNLFRFHRADGSVRQLCFDQDHAWCPAMLHNGRVLYLRWEYSDLPHSNSRILFHMNPDGTGQMEYYGSNSYWPNGIFYARAIPGHPTRVVGIVTGHHGVRRMGELVIFDPALGRREADGVVQRIPGHGKVVEPVVRDRLVDESWPKFLHPFPLGGADGRGSGVAFLVAMQPHAGALWGLYLVDIFDNLHLLRQESGYALFEPLPLKPMPAPPAVPDKTDPVRRDGLVYLADIYRGPGLEGVPRGEVRTLRLTSYTYGYRGMGGLYGTIGIDGPWDVRRILGTVPVEADGSAFFRVPANVPISVQPLDGEGKALQIMRSWFTAMPGEVLSCVGCHETQNEAPPSRQTRAARREPDDAVPWYGPARGFAFPREVQPVLDRHCVGCHNGQTTWRGKPVFSLRGDPLPTPWRSKMSGHAGGYGGKFSVGYVNLHRYVRHPGIESDMHLLNPLDFHADTTELVQVLRKGHHGVALRAEEWERLILWIDLNTPYHGDWTTISGQAARDVEMRRSEMRKTYAGVEEVHLPPEENAVGQGGAGSVPAPRAEVASPAAAPLPVLGGWPWPEGEAGRRQGRPPGRIGLGEGPPMDFVYIPAGEFLMGSVQGHADETPVGVVRLERGFWMARTEVTNAQFAAYDPTHDSRREHKQGYQFGVQGYPLQGPDQPVVRISWDQAQAFCEWLGGRMGAPVALPTEAQWEYACRAGTVSPMWYGGVDDDFSRWANLADAKTREFASNPYTPDQPIADPPEFDDWLPKDGRFSDGALVSAAVGSYGANPWGLCDLHGNVWEWTRSLYLPYPYAEDDGRNEPGAAGARVVRGGSWRDRPRRCTSAYRLAYRPYQEVFNVGFRVVVDADLPRLPGASGISAASSVPAGRGAVPSPPGGTPPYPRSSGMPPGAADSGAFPPGVPLVRAP
ncbi:MAG: SUMF1/EgtB/PvdO family nonheme iron enzyme [Lentisphaeria bacterium]|nr:SUMF1/EgtB/PvdO family nonheme iron enzyme [Lentisphaeria bacterium]